MIKQTTKVICDRCGKELTDGAYYTVSIDDHKIINRDDTYKNGSYAHLCSCELAIATIPLPERHFCSECAGVIRKFIYGW